MICIFFPFQGQLYNLIFFFVHFSFTGKQTGKYTAISHFFLKRLKSNVTGKYYENGLLINKHKYIGKNQKYLVKY